MRMNQWKYDEKIRQIAQSGEMPYPKEYEKKIQNICDNLPEEEKRKGRIPISVVRFGVAFCMLCLIVGIVPVSGALHGHWKRMEAMKEKEKQQYVSELVESDAEGDVYSRQFSDKELKRMEQLKVTYENGKTYPEGEITYISKAKDAKAEKVCFLAATSTFYFPEREMTDEELLELIDFYYKREYSFQKNQENKADLEEDTASSEEKTGQESLTLSKKEAIALGVQWIRKVYGKDVSDWSTTVEKVNSSRDGDDIYSISYLQANNLMEYQVELCAADGSVSEIDCMDNAKLSQPLEKLKIESVKKLKKRCEEVIEIGKMLDDSHTVKAAYCQYLLDQNNNLALDNVSFWLEYTDGTGLEVAYSYYDKEYTQIIFVKNMKELLRESFTSKKENLTKKIVRKKLQ